MSEFKSREEYLKSREQRLKGGQTKTNLNYQSDNASKDTAGDFGMKAGMFVRKKWKALSVLAINLILLIIFNDVIFPDKNGTSSHVGENIILLMIIVGVFALIMFLMGLYFLPANTAIKLKHRNASAIYLLNLLLGWTVVGWVAAYIWANTDYKNGIEEQLNGDMKKCPQCAEMVRAEAKLCRYCRSTLQ